jgi:hypothetical protein
VICNFRIPLGLIFAPTERGQASKLFGEVTVANDFFDDVRELSKGKDPLLSHGSASLLFGESNFAAQRYFCYRHYLESIGSGSFVALLSHGLLFTSGETEYAQFQTIATSDFAFAWKTAQDDAHARVMEVGLLQFCRIFGFEFSKDKQDLIDATRDPFR